MSAPASLLARSGDGTEKTLVSAGSSLPTSGKIVFGTSQAGQAAIELELLEDGERRVALARFELPRGLPANTWIPIEFRVSAEGVVRAEARENLRRLRVDAQWDSSEASAEHFRPG